MSSEQEVKNAPMKEASIAASAGLEQKPCQRRISLDIRRNDAGILFRGPRGQLARCMEEYPNISTQYNSQEEV
jgi:hypothetical protein